MKLFRHNSIALILIITSMMTGISQAQEGEVISEFANALQTAETVFLSAESNPRTAITDQFAASGVNLIIVTDWEQVPQSVDVLIIDSSMIATDNQQVANFYNRGVTLAFLDTTINQVRSLTGDSCLGAGIGNPNELQSAGPYFFVVTFVAQGDDPEEVNRAVSTMRQSCGEESADNIQGYITIHQAFSPGNYSDANSAQLINRIGIHHLRASASYANFSSRENAAPRNVIE
jgi:hypothetical protein